MSITSQIEEELNNHPLEDQPLILMQMEERLTDKRYSKNDYKKAMRARKKIRSKRLRNER